MAEPKLLCRRCHQRVTYTAHGWKHECGAHTGRSCGRKPTAADVIDERTIDAAVDDIAQAMQNRYSSPEG